jgi:hypothetical protein
MMLIRSLVGFVVIVAAMGLVTSVEQLFLARGDHGASSPASRRW